MSPYGYVERPPLQGVTSGATSRIVIPPRLESRRFATQTALNMATRPGTYSEIVLQDSPDQYFRFAETGSTIRDYTTNFNDGTAIGTVVSTQPSLLSDGSDFSRKLRQDGTVGVVRCDVSAPAVIGTQDCTFEIWIKDEDGNSDAAVCPLWHMNPTAADSLRVDLNNAGAGDDGKVRAEIITAANGATSVYGTSTDMFDGEIHHIVVLWDRDGEMSIWVNGAHEASVDISADSAESIGGNAYLGTRLTGDSGEELDMFVDEMAVYTTLLTEQKIVQHYERGTTTA